MDLTYVIPAIGVSDILFNYATELESPFFLFALTDPCGNSTKYSIVTPTGCDGDWILPVWGTQQMYEDLTAGIIYFQEPGSWAVGVYYQDNDTNIDPDNATYITGVIFQVREDD